MDLIIKGILKGILYKTPPVWWVGFSKGGGVGVRCHPWVISGLNICLFAFLFLGSLLCPFLARCSAAYLSACLGYLRATAAPAPLISVLPVSGSTSLL